MNLIDTFLDELESRHELIPGAREKLRRLAGDYRGGEAPRAIADLLTDLAGPGAGYLVPDARKSLKSAEPLRWVLDRMALRKGQAERLEAAWGVEMVDASVGTGLEDDPAPLTRAKVVAEVARRVVIKLDSDEYAPLRQSEPDRPYGELRVLDTLRKMQREGFISSSADLDELAGQMSDLASKSPAQAASLVARRLAMPHWSEYSPASGPPNEADVRDFFLSEPPDAAAAEVQALGGYDA
jgi:hypothetical protein